MFVVRETTHSGILAANSDRVCAYSPIAPGGTLVSVQGEIHMVGPEATPTAIFNAYGFSGSLEPLIDPDSSIDLNTFWDNMVVKPGPAASSAGSVNFDWDFDTTDTSPDVAVGELDLNAVAGLLTPGKEIIAPRIEWVSAAKNRGLGHDPAATPYDYQPTSYKTFRSNRRLAAQEGQAAYAMLALSSPILDNEDITQSTLATPADWAILGNLKNVMQDFWRVNAGMVDAGAESPYVEASLAIEELVAPDIVQPSTATIAAVQWTWLCHATWLLEFPDSSVPKTLDGR